MKGIGQYPIAPFKRLKHSIKRKRRIIDAFMNAAKSTGITVVFSVVVIPLAQVLCHQHLFASLVLIAGVALFGTCVWVYWLVISAVLGLRQFKSEEDQ